MDRLIQYTGAIPRVLDILLSNKNAMLADSFLARAVLGGATWVHGLGIAPTSPASLQVTIGAGSIYALDTVDATAYGDLGTDSHVVLKQGILADPVTLTITPPSTAGYSQVFLVQAILQNADSGSTVLSYYNASNPAVPYAGPANSGTSQNTLRQAKCTIALKAGAAAATGSQTTPSPDAGYTGLYAITVANGQTSITSANWATLATAPFFPTLPSIPGHVQNNDWVYADDTSGAANTVTVSLSPPITAYTKGMVIVSKIANTNTGATVLNAGAGSKSVVNPNGQTPAAGDIRAGAMAAFVYDGTNFQLAWSQRRLSPLGAVTRVVVCSTSQVVTVAANEVAVLVEAWGAGGGGGGAGTGASAGSGGGGGEYRMGYFAVSPGSLSVMIGAHGVKGLGYPTNSNGTDGGDTIIGSLMTCKGGQKGFSGSGSLQATVGYGGTGGSGGQIHYDGFTGSAAMSFGSTYAMAIGGYSHGQAYLPFAYNSGFANGQPGALPGNGGGGGLIGGNGGDGYDGLAILTFFG
jgi:hypothetical protein